MNKKPKKLRSKKIRLDEALLMKKMVASIKEAQALILTGTVLVDDKPITKSGSLILEDSVIRIKNQKQYVSRGGEKLDSILAKLPFSMQDRIAVDVGLSTGGFSDCLLQKGASYVLVQRGASRVYGIDVGYGQVAHKLTKEPKMGILERTNARTLSQAELQDKLTALKAPYSIEDFNLLVMDASFINTHKLLEPLKDVFPNISDWIILIKPQFEAKKDEIEPGGLISNPTTHKTILTRCEARFEALGFSVRQQLPSGLKGAKKQNQEVFFVLKKDLKKDTH